MAETFDFIIVGGGTSGCVVARRRRLADTSSALKVLLLEGGRTNEDPNLRVPAGRWTLFMTEPSVNWAYKSTSQHQLNGQVFDCHRDKEDYDKWAEIVRDSDWKCDGGRGVKQRLRKVKMQHVGLTEMHAKYLDITSLESHSKEGMVDLTFDKEWPEVGTSTYEAAKEWGMKWNGVMNTGVPKGWGLGPSTFYQGSRVTSSRAYLTLPQNNLTILTEKVVTKVLFDKSKKAVGVQTSSGSNYIANKEVNLWAGAIDSPRILLLSGIGPEVELSKISIPVIHKVPGVGKDLKDHPIFTTTLLLKPREKVGTQDLDPLDPLYNVGVQMRSAWLSPPAIYASEEYAALDEETKAHLLKVPLIEFGTNNPPFTARDLQEGAEVITFFAGVMNSQSSGSVALSSANPSEPPVINLNYCSHPYDKQAAIEGFRSLMEFSGLPTYAAITESRIEGLSGYSDEEIWEHCKKSIGPIYHFGGTCTMGKEKDEMVVVDEEFKVRGVRGLRIVDHVVAPLMTNNHTHSTCYLIGETAAEKIIAEYKLSYEVARLFHVISREFRYSA